MNIFSSPKITLFTVLLCSVVKFTYAQQYIVSGYVSSAEGDERLPGAHVYDTNSFLGTATNAFGFFSLELSEGEHQLSVSFVGQEQKMLTILVKSDTTLHIQLQSGTVLDQVQVLAHRRPSYGVVQLTPQQIELLPNMTGDADLLRSYQFSPGVAQGTEGSNSIYVRGGTPDQNLILLDDVPMYYVNHVGGFFSVFNEQSISAVNMYKSEVPARYGGRLSSVIDVRLKNGNMKEHHRSTSIGLYSMKLFAEGPVKVDTSSYMVSLRKSLTDFYMFPLTKLTQGDIMAAYGFWDFNGKYQHKLKNNDRVYVSLYGGRDYYTVRVDDALTQEGDRTVYIYDEEEGEYYPHFYDDPSCEQYSDQAQTISWGNYLGCVRWNHQFSRRWFSNMSIAFTDYTYKSKYWIETAYAGDKQNLEEKSYTYKTGIEDLILKMDNNYQFDDKFYFDFGSELTTHRFKTGKIEESYSIDQDLVKDIDSTLYQSFTNYDSISGDKDQYFCDLSVYGDAKIQWCSQLHTNIGLRISSYFNGNSFYISPQPRLSVQYSYDQRNTLSAAYTLNTQFLHMLSSSSSSMPANVWVPASEEIKPEHCHQLSFGYAFLDKTEGVKFSADIYGKYFMNLLEYTSNPDYATSQQELLSKIEADGRGVAFGLELGASKNMGNWTGQAAYTLSRSLRQFPGLNQGSWYKHTFDRPHDLSLLVSYTPNKKVSLSGSWEFRSGSLLTMSSMSQQAYFMESSVSEPWDTPANNPISYLSDAQSVVYYNEKNNYRMPFYHKLNLSARFEKEKRRGKRVWTFGVNNVYNRMNAYSIYYDDNMELKKMTIFPIMPSISYQYKF